MRSDFALLSQGMDGYKDWRDIDPHEFLARHSGARGGAREPESISAAVSALAAVALGGNDDLKGSA